MIFSYLMYICILTVHIRRYIVCRVAKKHVDPMKFDTFSTITFMYIVYISNCIHLYCMYLYLVFNNINDKLQYIDLSIYRYYLFCRYLYKLFQSIKLYMIGIHKRIPIISDFLTTKSNKMCYVFTRIIYYITDAQSFRISAVHQYNVIGI